MIYKLPIESFYYDNEEKRIGFNYQFFNDFVRDVFNCVPLGRFVIGDTTIDVRSTWGLLCYDNYYNRLVYFTETFDYLHEEEIILEINSYFNPKFINLNELKQKIDVYLIPNSHNINLSITKLVIITEDISTTGYLSYLKREHNNLFSNEWNEGNSTCSKYFSSWRKYNSFEWWVFKSLDKDICFIEKVQNDFIGNIISDEIDYNNFINYLQHKKSVLKVFDLFTEFIKYNFNCKIVIDFEINYNSIYNSICKILEGFDYEKKYINKNRLEDDEDYEYYVSNEEKGFLMEFTSIEFLKKTSKKNLQDKLNKFFEFSLKYIPKLNYEYRKPINVFDYCNILFSIKSYIKVPELLYKVHFINNTCDTIIFNDFIVIDFISSKEKKLISSLNVRDTTQLNDIESFIKSNLIYLDNQKIEEGSINIQTEEGFSITTGDFKDLDSYSDDTPNPVDDLPF